MVLFLDIDSTKFLLYNLMFRSGGVDEVPVHSQLRSRPSGQLAGYNNRIPAAARTGALAHRHVR